MTTSIGTMDDHIREEIIQFFKAIAPEAHHIEDAAYMLQLASVEDIAMYMQTVKMLLQEGILTSKDGVYISYQKEKKREDFLQGVYEKNRNGSGFVIIEGGIDVYIAAENRMGAVHQDIVSVKVIKQGTVKKAPEGRIERIIKRGIQEVVGTFQREKYFGFVTPDNELIDQDVFIPLTQCQDIRSEAKVLVKITRWPVNKAPEGTIEAVLGYKDTPGVDVNCIMAEHKIPFQFPKQVLLEAEKLSSSIVLEKGRLDLRDEVLITIDGEDAKDLDDAVSVVRLANGNYKLGVHIADVSHYVKKGTPLDEEAYERGTSVYLADRVIPMLPERLSNGLCSLQAGEDRYAMSCIMEINGEGRVVHYHITPSLIHVQRRCSYTEVYQALEEDIIPENLQHFMPLLKELRSLQEVLENMRLRRGAITFDFPEYKAILDDKGMPLRFVERKRTIAEKIIEECMLIANETVATFLEKKVNISVYRIHEIPKEEKIETVRRLLPYVGIRTKMLDSITPMMYQKILSEVENTSYEHMLQTVVLRSMPQAKYSVDNEGHFGLASTCYTHFTSPIRRYPDLMVHRLLKYALRIQGEYTKTDYEETYLTKAAEHSSMREQRAVSAEREVMDHKRAQYMEKYIGHTFKGRISSVTNFGFFVEVDYGIDGLVHISTLKKDYYIYDEERFSLVGELSGISYTLDQEVEVIVAKVDVNRATIDFMLDTGEQEPSLLRRNMKLGGGLDVSRPKKKKKHKGLRKRKGKLG